MIPINEIFTTIQGEATFTGMPSLFIRTQGCPVGCAFCDTKYTWEQLEHKRISNFDLLNKQGKESDEWAEFDYAYLVELAAKVPHVVITGGEPFMHNLSPLINALLDGGKTVQVETSGTYPIICPPQTFITLSPKLGMMGGLTVPAEALNMADEIKMPVGKETDIEKLLTFLESNTQRKHGNVPVWLQPLSQSPKATELCVKECLARGWRLSVQTHKYVGLQ